MLKHFLQSDYVGNKTFTTVNKCVSKLEAHVASFPPELKLSVVVVGSYSAGLASRTQSMLDVLVRMEWSGRTLSLPGDQLTQALMAGFKECSFLSNFRPSTDNSGMLICDSQDSDFSIRFHACNAETFPVTALYHSKLFNSYALCDPRFPVLIESIKRWARISRFSMQTTSGQCPLNGFHWTVIVLFFLVETRLAPNLFSATKWLRDCAVEQFGPREDEHAFIVVPDSSAGKRITITNENKSLSIGDFVFRFFDWLGQTDLLSTTICLQRAASDVRPTPARGWITILNPTLPYEENTVDSSIDQKAQVIFAMKVQREAKRVASSLKGVTEQQMVEILYVNSVGSVAHGARIDVAIP